MPRSTARLHEGLQVEVDGDVVQVVSTAPYGRFIHDGTVEVEAVPFPRQAATRAGSRAGELVR
jgi:hypothetical protein